MYELKVIVRFAAAHQLKMVAQKCENLHGHNWKIEACVAGEHLNSAGVLMDFGELKGHVKAIVGRLDHRFLNESEGFSDEMPPSSENIAAWIAERLQAAIRQPGVRVTRVRAWESEDACAQYVVPAGGSPA